MLQTANLQKVHIAAGCTNIGDYAFSNCVKLKEIYIPETVKSIGNGVFYNCRELTVYGKSGSVALKYAKENKIKFAEI